MNIASQPGADTTFQKSQSKLLNKFPRGEIKQKQVFSLIQNEVSFPSTYEALNFINLPLNVFVTYYFQGVDKGCIGNEWVHINIQNFHC